jgi:hypothetical protein
MSAPPLAESVAAYERSFARYVELSEALSAIRRVERPRGETSARLTISPEHVGALSRAWDGDRPRCCCRT